jgi:hypothetical protein
MDMAQVQRLPAYDHTFFQALLNTPISKFKSFGLNAAECSSTTPTL